MCKVRCLKSDQIYALKAIEKKSEHDAETNRLRSQIQREAELQQAVLHGGVVGCKSIFEDKSNFYLLLEYCENGDLYRYFGPE